ncbi:hypothetical protein CC86DRAFT_126929 [Ophiobolus disseminans]|uniref:Uncharacterized protein n=1 Tax=Ophiobolus disseminans TaxID=1469910 RepID=A0A6A6ZHI7_9PLEO|nr:hypothetical protein CC86DRAFT_126929 [Ophiobolus disseminans]
MIFLSRPVLYSNIWDDEVELRDSLMSREDFYQQDLPPLFFGRRCAQNSSKFRLQRYPSASQPHRLEDHNPIVQGSVGGLEVESQDEKGNCISVGSEGRPSSYWT